MLLKVAMEAKHGPTVIHLATELKDCTDLRPEHRLAAYRNLFLAQFSKNDFRSAARALTETHMFLKEYYPDNTNQSTEIRNFVKLILMRDVVLGKDNTKLDECEKLLWQAYDHDKAMLENNSSKHSPQVVKDIQLLFVTRMMRNTKTSQHLNSYEVTLKWLINTQNITKKHNHATFLTQHFMRDIKSGNSALCKPYFDDINPPNVKLSEMQIKEIMQNLEQQSSRQV